MEYNTYKRILEDTTSLYYKAQMGEAAESVDERRHAIEKLKVRLGIIKTVNTTDIDIEDVTLLSVKEAIKVPRKLRQLNWQVRWYNEEWWWLRDGFKGNDVNDYNKNNAALIKTDGHFTNDFTYSRIAGVRPVLKISNLESLNLTTGNKFWFAGYTWTIINNNTALCNDIVGHSPFIKALEDRWSRPKTHPNTHSSLYEASDIKKWLEDWAKEKGIINNQERFLEGEEETEEEEEEEIDLD